MRHSLSPVIHNSAFKRMGWNAVYLAFEVSRSQGSHGRNPGTGNSGGQHHPSLQDRSHSLPRSEVEGIAGKIKAVNTIVNEEGRLIGYNTDWQRGRRRPWKEKVDLKGKKVLLLGAGGTARAIGFGLREKGCELTIVNRSPEKGNALAKELGCVFKPLSSLDGTGGGRADQCDVRGHASQHRRKPRSEEVPGEEG